MEENLIDEEKLERYNKHINRLENLIKSVKIKGQYEEYRIIPCLMLVNFIDLLRSVTILDIKHMSVSGNIIIRSMFEVLLDFLYCETDRKLYLRYADYQFAKRKILYDKLPQYIKDDVDKENFENVVTPNYEKFKKQYNIKNQNQLFNWCDKTIYQRVKIVSKRNPDIFDLFYKIYEPNCLDTHNYVGTIKQYVRYKNGDLLLNYDNIYNEDKFWLMKQINSLVDIFYDDFEKQYANKSLADLKF